MPEWMESFRDNIQIKDKESLNIDFDKRGAFANTASVNRDNVDATPREVIAELNNDKMVIDSKVELAKFLLGKYYKTDTKVDKDTVYLNTTIDGIQAKFIFSYKFTNGKLIADSTFNINGEEYPFSKAGFDESLMDLKNGLIKKPTEKIASTRETYFINREEIIRRFNGHLREATDSINKFVSEGTMVGAGSNSYATFYNPDELFPQMEKAKPQLPTGSFEYVDNTEHVATNEFKSAKKLSLEASKIMSNLFTDYIINKSVRDNNELLLNATVFNSNNGIRHNVNFNFEIQNEKVASLRLAEINNQRMTVEQLLNRLNLNNNLVKEYLKTASASKRVCDGIILTERELKDKLGPIVGINKVSDFINGWLSVYAISAINSTTYYSSNTIEELLDMVVSDTLTNEQIAQINEYKKVFGSGMDFDRIEQKDTGNRDLEDIDLINEYKLAKINSELSKKFKNFQITAFNDDNINVSFTNNGVKHSMKLVAGFNGRKLEKLNAVINNQQVGIDNLTKAFEVNPLLSAYLQQGNEVNNSNSGIVASERSLLEKLSNLTPDSKVVLEAWKKNYLKEVSNQVYTSKYSFEELLNKTTASLFTQEQLVKLNDAKKTFGMALERIDEKDTGVRDIDEAELSTEMKLARINNELSKNLKNFQITGFDNDKVNISFVNDGVRHSLRIEAKFNDRKLEKLNAIINNKAVEVNQLTKAFKANPLLSVYLQENKTTNFNSGIVASERNLLERLAKLTPDSNNVLNTWKKNYLKEIGAGLYTSVYSFEELLNKTTANLFTDKERQQILLAKQYFGNAFERIAEKDTGIRDMESRVNNETLLYEANNFLSQNFSNYIPEDFKSQGESANYSISLFDENTGLSTCVNFSFAFNNNKVASCHANVNGELIELSNIKKVFAMNETLSKYLQINAGKKFNAPMVISKNDLMRRLSSITNADNIEIDNIINTWQQFGKIHQLDMNTFASKSSLEQLISMSNIKPLSDEEIILKFNKAKRNKEMQVTSNHIKDNDTRQPEEIWSAEKMALHARATINSMFADFDIIDAEMNNNDYIITARIINPVNGLKQSLSFKFATLNGTRLGDLNTISNGIKTVNASKILELLESDNEAINRFIKLNGASTKQYKNIISTSNLKTKLSTMINPKDYNNIVNDLVKSAILNPIDNFNFASEYSFAELIEYLSNTDKLNLKVADNHLKTYAKDASVDTNVKHIKDTDNRILERKEEKLSPTLINASNKIRTVMANASNNKKITANKYNSLLSMLDTAKNGNDIEIVWRELQRYL
jgi:hypothetical protein